MGDHATPQDGTAVEEQAAAAPTSRSLEISNAIARLHKQYVGRGPTNTRTTIDSELVVCLLDGGYTRAEQTLADNDRSDLVEAARAGLQASMREAMVKNVEEIVGRRVLSCMSATDQERDLQAEIFVLVPGHEDAA